MWRADGRCAVLALVFLCACATGEGAPTGDDETPSGAQPDGQERGPTRALREAARDPERAAEDLNALSVGRSATPVAVHLSVGPIEATEGEDGRGAHVPAIDPAALDLRRTDGWPGRALDPTLTIGALSFHAYTHVDGEVLRYVAADVGELPTDAPAYVQWGDDESSRIEAVRTVAAPSGGVVR